MKKPLNADAYFSRGVVSYDSGQYERAIEDFDQAITLNPKYAAAYNNRATEYSITKKYDDTWNDVKKAQDLGFQIHPEVLNALREASPKAR